MVVIVYSINKCDEVPMRETKESTVNKPMLEKNRTKQHNNIEPS